MIYLKSFKDGIATCFDNCGKEFEIGINQLIWKDNVYGKREYDKHIVIPRVRKEWCLYSKKDLDIIVEENKRTILKKKLLGKLDFDDYLLNVSDCMSYYNMFGEISRQPIFFMVYTKESGTAILDLASSKDNIIRLLYVPDFKIKLNKSDDSNYKGEVYYKNNTWYFCPSFLNRGYHISLDKLFESDV